MPWTKSIDPVEACFANARDLLRAAKRVLDDEKLPNVAFHLAILALEEIGKAALLGTRAIARTVEDETVFIDNRLDDHVFKLFWALWTPGFARGKVSKEEFESLRGMARTMHDDRLAAMYVSIPKAGKSCRMSSEERARMIVGLTEARLGMEASRDWQAIDMSAGSVMRWFLDATSDPEKRSLIFGQKSFDKLAELGQMRDWMTWLKAAIRSGRSGRPRASPTRTCPRCARPIPTRHRQVAGRHPSLFAGAVDPQQRDQIVERAADLDQAVRGS